MSKPALHVLFCPSTAASLKEALAKLGRTDAVVALFDDLSFGPLGGTDSARAAWVEDQLGYIDWERPIARTAPVLDAARADDSLAVVWTSRRDARNYAGFPWWLSNRGEGPFKVIDVFDAAHRAGPSYPSQARYAISPGVLGPDELTCLLGFGVDLSPEQRAEHRARWARLVSEDAPLRVIDDDGALVSAPLTHFDALLLSHATTTWQRMSALVGRTLAGFMDDRAQAGDLVLASRAYSLAETGALEWRGDMSSIRTCEVRLPRSIG